MLNRISQLSEIAPFLPVASLVNAMNRQHAKLARSDKTSASPSRQRGESVPLGPQVRFVALLLSKFRAVAICQPARSYSLPNKHAVIITVIITCTIRSSLSPKTTKREQAGLRMQKA